MLKTSPALLARTGRSLPLHRGGGGKPLSSVFGAETKAVYTHQWDVVEIQAPWQHGPRSLERLAQEAPGCLSQQL